MANAPYQVVQSVFDNAVATATSLQTAAASQVAGITATLSGLVLPGQISVAPYVPPTVTVPTITPPAAPTYSIPGSSVVADTFATDYAAKLTDAQNAITANLSTFFSTYFPMTLNDTELTLGQGWVINVLTGGGAMNPSIENQYWQRDRDRVAREIAVKVAETTASWASRGFPLPPGAAVGAVLAAQRTGLEQGAESSRNVAVKKYETEVLLQQEAIKVAISLRTQAMAAMSDFIKTLVFAPRDDAQEYGKVSVQATSIANDALTKYFSATTSANISLIEAQADVAIKTAEVAVDVAKLSVDSTVQLGDLALRAELGIADITVRQNETAGNWTVAIASKRIDAAIAAAQMNATMASAALNGIHATAGVSGNSSDNTQFYG